MTDWYVGQKVVCVVDAWTLHCSAAPARYPERGRVYTIAGINPYSPLICAAEAPFFVLAELDLHQYAHRGFKPLEDQHAEQFRKMIEPAELAKFRETAEPAIAK